MDNKILVIDDSSALVEALTKILINHGYNAKSCEDGESGWEHLLAEEKGTDTRTGLILLDVNMPGIDGLTLLRRIRADTRFAGIPVIIITARNDSKTRSAALEAGADDYFLKPFKLRELLARVETLLNGNQQRRRASLVEAGYAS